MKLPEEIEKFIPVFLALDEKTKEAFLSRVNTLTLSYRIRIGADNSYRVVTPEATPVARRLSELLARVLTAAQRMGTLVKEEKVMLTPRLVRVIKDTNDLWADDGVRIPSVVYGPLEAALNRQIDIFRAVEIEARYHKTPPRYRKDNFKDFKAIELTDDLDALLEHVRANRNRGTGETHQAQNAGQSVDAPDAESGADPATD
ncbi:MAG: hypothetical protein LBU06_10520 [Desulfovibrio sp.]|nr:hypothetical protein [Desulfovibrio sp.]